MKLEIKWNTWLKPALKVVALSFLTIGMFTSVVKTIQNWDDDPDRGAAMLSENQFGDHYDTIFPNKDSGEYISWQGWSPDDSMWFYTTTQGSDLLPYDFFMVLEQEKSTELFRADKNMDFYRYIPLKPTFSNPDGLALGFVKDSYKGKDYMGLTCAACHTTQVNYNGVAMRIDGGPALANMENFVIDMSKALRQTLNDPKKEQRFIDAVMDRNGFAAWISGGRNYTSEEKVKEDMEKFASRIEDYVFINRSHLQYGYGRLDAFGRIYNRTLQHVLNKEQLEKALSKVLEPDVSAEIIKDIDASVLTDNEFDHVVERIKPLLSLKQLVTLKRELFNEPDAPVSYPFLWDIPQHDYVQWNGIAANAGLGPIGRNSGEAIGVFGTLDWVEEDGFSLSAFIGGQTGHKRHISYDSSINVNNLERMESHLRDLTSPVWPETVLPKIDKALALKGSTIYRKNCLSCHALIERTDPSRQVVANFTSVKKIGTDPKMASNALAYQGRSGILEKQYLSLGEGSLVLEEKMPVAVLLTAATTNVVATPDPDKWFIRRWADWAYTLTASFFDNDVKASLKRGDYEPDTTVNPFASLMAYKARPLNGIWATAPYLHNGSVPTLYDLLLPKKKPGDPKDGEYRPDEFYMGSREFDPNKVGLKSRGYKGSRFLTHLTGNSNAGHNYADGMSKYQRLELLEYLKTL